MSRRWGQVGVPGGRARRHPVGRVFNPTNQTSAGAFQKSQVMWLKGDGSLSS